MDASSILVIAALGVGAVDWFSVATGRSRLEEVAKPLVMVLLVGAAVTSSIPDAGVRWLVVGGLVFGVVGDVLLLPRFDRFVPGLAAFLVGHVLYTIGFARLGLEIMWVPVGVIVAIALLEIAGLPIVRAIKGSSLAVPVQLYIGAIAGMVGIAIATGEPALAAGAVVFALSDALLGHDRFVTPDADHRVMVHVLYHLGQAAIVVAL